MAILWITEAIPIPATGLLPLALFPLLGVGSIEETAAAYANPILFVLLGGFLLAASMERWGLHRRLALSMIRRTGTATSACRANAGTGLVPSGHAKSKG